MVMTTSSVYGEEPRQETVVVMDSKPKAPKQQTAWARNIAEMHSKFGVNPVVRNFDQEKLKAFLEFRIKFLQEELNEMKDATVAEDVTDALIDLCVVAIGTLDAFDIDADKAWDRVHNANMQKSPGVKPNRPNPLGLPDLIKPEGWESPRHFDNVGLLSKIMPTGEHNKE